MNYTIIPSVMGATQEEVDASFNKVKDHFSLLQLDVVDGKVAESHSLDFDFTLPEANYEAHLMMEDPREWIAAHGPAMETIIVQADAKVPVQELIDLIKGMGKCVGLGVNIDVPIEAIKPYLDKLDHVTIMTVNIGFYGSPFIPEALEKVKELRALKPELDIEVDGGISDETIEAAIAAGANKFICGSYLQKAPNVKEALERLQTLLP